MSKPICDLVKTLNPGTKIKFITTQGTSIQISNFMSYNESTRLATFINSEGNTVVVDCEGIISIEFSTQ